MKIKNGKLVLNGVEYENPLDSLPLSKRTVQYQEGKEGERTTFRIVWLDRYTYPIGKHDIPDGFESHALKMTNRGKCTLDGKDLKNAEDITSVKELFSQIKVV